MRWHSGVRHPAIAYALFNRQPPGSPSALAQSAWFIDSTSGSDSNSGEEGAPVATFAEIIRRFGTPSPVFDFVPTFEWLDSSPLTDPVIFSPFLVGGGGVRLTGQLTQAGSATIATYTPQNPAAGTLNTITALGAPSNFWAQFVGSTVHDVTAGAQFHILQDLGNATAVISSPKAYPIVGFGADVTIAGGDQLLIFKTPTIPITYLSATGFGDLSGGGCQVSQLDITGDSFSIVGSECNFTECTVNNSTIESAHTFEGSVGPGFISCFLMSGSFGASPPFSGRGAFFGGALQGGANNFLDGSTLDGDVALLTHIHTAGTVKFGRCYMADVPTNDNPPTTYWILNQSYGSPRLWGPAGLNPSHGSQVLLSGVTATSALLLTGPLTLDDGATGFPWVPGSNAYGPATAITAAALDSNGGLSNPATRSAYAFGPLS